MDCVLNHAGSGPLLGPAGPTPVPVCPLSFYIPAACIPGCRLTASQISSGTFNDSSKDSLHQQLYQADNHAAPPQLCKASSRKDPSNVGGSSSRSGKDSGCVDAFVAAQHSRHLKKLLRVALGAAANQRLLPAPLQQVQPPPSEAAAAAEGALGAAPGTVAAAAACGTAGKLGLARKQHDGTAAAACGSAGKLGLARKQHKGAAAAAACGIAGKLGPCRKQHDTAQLQQHAHVQTQQQCLGLQEGERQGAGDLCHPWLQLQAEVRGLGWNCCGYVLLQLLWELPEDRSHLGHSGDTSDRGPVARGLLKIHTGMHADGAEKGGLRELELARAVLQDLLLSKSDIGSGAEKPKSCSEKWQLGQTGGNDPGSPCSESVGTAAGQKEAQLPQRQEQQQEDAKLQQLLQQHGQQQQLHGNVSLVTACIEKSGYTVSDVKVLPLGQLQQQLQQRCQHTQRVTTRQGASAKGCEGYKGGRLVRIGDGEEDGAGCAAAGAVVASDTPGHETLSIAGECMGGISSHAALAMAGGGGRSSSAAECLQDVTVTHAALALGAGVDAESCGELHRVKCYEMRVPGIACHPVIEVAAVATAEVGRAGGDYGDLLSLRELLFVGLAAAEEKGWCVCSVVLAGGKEHGWGLYVCYPATAACAAAVAARSKSLLSLGGVVS